MEGKRAPRHGAKVLIELLLTMVATDKDNLQNSKEAATMLNQVTIILM